MDSPTTACSRRSSAIPCSPLASSPHSSPGTTEYEKVERRHRQELGTRHASAAAGNVYAASRCRRRLRPTRLQSPDIRGMALTTTPTIRSIRARPVQVPFKRPPLSASGALPSAALVFVDLETREGLTGGSYLFAFSPWALEPLRPPVCVSPPSVRGPGAVPSPCGPATLSACASRVYWTFGYSTKVHRYGMRTAPRATTTRQDSRAGRGDVSCLAAASRISWISASNFRCSRMARARSRSSAARGSARRRVIAASSGPRARAPWRWRAQCRARRR